MASTTDYRDDNQTAAAKAAAALKAASDAERMASASRVNLGAYTLTFGGALVTVSAGDKIVRQAVPGAKVGDRVYVHEAIAVPDSVSAYGTACVEADNVVRIKLKVPALAIGVKLDVPVVLIAYRPL